MAASDFFNNTSDLKVYVPDVSVSTPIDVYEYAFRSPENKLINLIGQDVYNQLKAYYGEIDHEDDAILDAGIKLIQGAIGNLVGYNIFIFDAKERNTNNSMYKYQEDQQLQAYLNGANDELGRLLTHLDANTEKYVNWEETTLFKTRQSQIIKTYTEFGTYYYIDESAYFFSKIVFLMKEITADKINPIIGSFGELDAEEDATIIEKVKQTLAYLTVAMSLRRFDFIEIPKTIRNNVSDEKSRTIRTSGMEGSAVARVASDIEMKGTNYLLELDRMMEKKLTGSLDVPEDIQTEDDNFYLQT